MNKIVREHYPVADLPENLRDGLPDDVSVSVTIEVERSKAHSPPTLKELLSLRRPPYRTTEDIVDDIRRYFLSADRRIFCPSSIRRVIPDDNGLAEIEASLDA